MDVFVDDQKVDFSCETSETLEQALKRLGQQCCPAGHVVVGVRCDGVHLSDEALDKAMSSPAGDYGCIEVVTAKPAHLVTSALNVASDMLTEVDRDRERVAGLFSEGKTDEGIAALAKCLAVWQQVHEAIRKSIQMLEVDPAGVHVSGQPLDEALSLPMGRLERLRDALAQRDYVLLADVLQYEFEEVITQWQALIEAIKELALNDSASSISVVGLGGRIPPADS